MTLKYLKKHYNIVIFLNILLIIGIILGLILGFKQDSIFKTDIVNSLTDLQNLLLTNRINNIFYHFLIFIILVISYFIMPLFFINFIIILFKGLTIGFSIYISLATWLSIQKNHTTEFTDLIWIYISYHCR